MNGHGGEKAHFHGDKVNGHSHDKLNGHANEDKVNGHPHEKENGHAEVKVNGHKNSTFYNVKSNAVALEADLEPYKPNGHRTDLESPPKIPKKVALKI